MIIIQAKMFHAIFYTALKYVQHIYRPLEGDPPLDGTWDQTGSDSIQLLVDTQTLVNTLPSLVIGKNCLVDIKMLTL